MKMSNQSPSVKPCKNVLQCGVKVLEAPESIRTGTCLRCRGYYDTKDKSERDIIFYGEKVTTINNTKGEE